MISSSNFKVEFINLIYYKSGVALSMRTQEKFHVWIKIRKVIFILPVSSQTNSSMDKAQRFTRFSVGTSTLQKIGNYEEINENDLQCISKLINSDRNILRPTKCNRGSLKPRKF